MYGTTEIGVVPVNYPGAKDYVVRPGSLGKPVPGVRLEVRTPDRARAKVGETAELFVERRGQWCCETVKPWRLPHPERLGSGLRFVQKL
jgi:acetyl-CoA synthetase